MKLILLILSMLCFKVSMLGQKSINSQAYEVFQLSYSEKNSNKKENEEITLLQKEIPYNIFQAVSKINAILDHQLGTISIPKAYFFTKKYCQNIDRNCFMEYPIGTKTYIHEVIVAKNNHQTEFFLLQSAFEPMSMNNDTFIAIQPIRVATNKILYLKFLGYQNERNKYQLIENDLTQSTNRLISNISLEKSKYIDFFKLKENKILYGGVKPNGQHWFDSLFLTDK